MLQTGCPGGVGEVGGCKKDKGSWAQEAWPCGGWSPQVVGPEGAREGYEYKGNKVSEGLMKP